MAKLCRTREEQVEKESAESWPAPALCSYCLQHEPSLSRASLHSNKMETTCEASLNVNDSKLSSVFCVL